MLAFADDLVLVAPSSVELQLLFNCFAAFCEANDLQINTDKTKTMYVNCTGKLLLNQQEIKTVNEFKYLGLIVSNKSFKPDILL
jgi:hypothetical protein